MLRRVGIVAAAVGFVAVGMAAPASAATPAAVTIDLPARAATAAEGARLDALAASYGCNAGEDKANNSWVHVCFERNGDRLWVHDDQPDGERARGHLLFKQKHFRCDNERGYNNGWVGCSYAREIPEKKIVTYYGTTHNGKSGPAHHRTHNQREPTS